MHTMIWSFS